MWARKCCTEVRQHWLRLFVLLAVIVYAVLNYDLITSSLLRSGGYPAFLEHDASLVTFKGRDSSCQLGQYWEKSKCTTNLHFSFCTKSEHSALNPLQAVYPYHPGYVGPCKAGEDVCLKIVFTVGDALECGLHALNGSRITCLAVFTQTSISKAFFDQLLLPDVKDVYVPVAATTFPNSTFRRGFDFLLPVDYSTAAGRSANRFNDSFLILPARRQLLLCFSAGHLRSVQLREIQLLQDLKRLNLDGASGGQNMSIEFFQKKRGWKICWPEVDKNLSELKDSSWYPCSNLPELLKKSTFGLVIQTEQNADPLGWQTQLAECLANGAIPVLIGDGPLPGDEAITQSQWNKAIIRTALTSAEKLMELLKSLTDEEIVGMRREGLIIFNRYYFDENARMSTLLLAIARRLRYPPPKAPMIKKKILHLEIPVTGTVHLSNETEAVGHETNLGLQDDRVYPFWSYPSTPWDPVLPSDVFLNQSYFGGRNYDEQLGYDYPKEEITAVVLVYDRLQLAYETVKSLDGMKYLNSVIVVYNNPNGTLENASWPKIHVPVYVIQSEQNSLNNRFLPYSLIRTNAIFSIDDDSRPSQSSILETFRLWRSNRDRLVGYVARNHRALNGSWRYGAGANQYYSMILTGITIFHRYYLYAYTYEMPATIRKLVDEQMNCEDIAMNFLVAHLSRKPPLLTSAKPSFACSGCKSALSLRAGHYNKRSQCLNALKAIYGYTPLVYTTMKGQTILR